MPLQSTKDVGHFRGLKACLLYTVRSTDYWRDMLIASPRVTSAGRANLDASHDSWPLTTLVEFLDVIFLGPADSAELHWRRIYNCMCGIGGAMGPESSSIAINALRRMRATSRWNGSAAARE